MTHMDSPEKLVPLATIALIVGFAIVAIGLSALNAVFG